MPNRAAIEQAITASLRRGLAICVGLELQPTPEPIRYRNLSDVQAMTDSSGRTYIPMHVWRSANSVFTLFNENDCSLKFSKNGRSISLFGGTAFAMVDGQDRPTSSAVVFRDGKWWVPFGVIDPLL